MRHVLLGISIITGITAAASTAFAGTTASKPPCLPKLMTIQGHRAAVNCGPATATLRIDGHTYTFHNGFCEQSKAAGSTLELNLGTVVPGVKNNLGKADFSMLLGRVHTSGSVFGAHYGGKSLLLGESLINARGSIPAKGTFASTVSFGGKFSGSWDCHGVVWKGP